MSNYNNQKRECKNCLKWIKNSKFAAHLHSCFDDSSDEESIAHLSLKKQKLSDQPDQTSLDYDSMDMMDFELDVEQPDSDLDEWVDEDEFIDVKKAKRHYVLLNAEEHIQVMDCKNQEIHEIWKDGNVGKRAVADMVRWYKKHHPGKELRIILFTKSIKWCIFRSPWSPFFIQSDNNQQEANGHKDK